MYNLLTNGTLLFLLGLEVAPSLNQGHLCSVVWAGVTADLRVGWVGVILGSLISRS